MSIQNLTSLDGTTALVTGSARRIGAAIVRSLHSAGANVAVHYRGSADDASELVATLNALRGDSARAFQADLAEASACAPLIDAVVAWHERLDVLVNNASSFFATPLGSITEAQWSDLTGSNLKAPLFLSQAAWPHLRAHAGNIVNIVDVHAQRPLRHYAPYVSAKAGLEMLTKSLAKEMAPDVRVNGVAPGAILWPEDDMSDAVKASILEQIPLRRSGEAADIANCVLFLLQEGTYMTGCVIPVDGGRSASW